MRAYFVNPLSCDRELLKTHVVRGKRIFLNWMGHIKMYFLGNLKQPLHLWQNLIDYIYQMVQIFQLSIFIVAFQANINCLYTSCY